MASRDINALTGRTLGDFVIADKIGEGGFGVVYRAVQPLLDRPAVIKVLHTRYRSTGGIAERFLREAHVASRLDHPYAAHIYGFGAEPDGTLWISMELVRGTTLAEYLRAHGPMPAERLAPLLGRICEVVHTAHEHGIVHRDLKPANVMVLTRAGRLLPKLLDFGIAKVVSEGSAAADAPRDAASAPAGGDTQPPAAGDITQVFDEAATPRSDERRRPAFDAALTQRGAMMGSPHYAAPEQWTDAASVGPRTDIYALGIIAYECLTGAPPFRAAFKEELGVAHASAPVPPLPTHLPRALDAVLARALAKRPDDRYADALELAAAFRSAAGGPDERPALPALDAALRARFVADAPQPIAEAVAAFDAARDPRQARDALWVITDVLARHIGVLALAARSRTGLAYEVTGALPLLRRIGVELCSDETWLELAEVLLRADAERPALHVIPELVVAMCGAGDGDAEAPRAFAALRELRAGLADAAATDAVLIERLERAVELLSALLRATELVCDYPLVVPITDRLAERWSGSRRAPRLAVPLIGAGIAHGQPILTDADGAPLVALAPLVQIAAPAPGAAVEVFSYAGHDARGGRLTAAPSPFLLHDDAVVEWLRVQIGSTLDESEQAARDERSPYRGLDAFTAADAADFLGRERVVDALVNRLRVEPMLAVVGQSGAGKSSLVQAGVLPALGDGWRTIVVRPGAAPLQTLAARLRDAGIAMSEIADAGQSARLIASPASFGRALRADAAVHGPIALVVDQLEELFTLTRDAAERQAFADAITSAARAADDPVRLVVTLRDDFLVAAEALPALRDRLAHSLVLVTTPARDDLERILVEPARRAGFEFEDPALPARMIAEVADQPGALALLSFTAAQLWERRDRHFNRLTTSAYETIGGVAGALAGHAEHVLTASTRDEQRLVREAFRHLVTADGTRAVLSRRELVGAMRGAAAGAVIERLVRSRLLVAHEAAHSDEADEEIEIAHEALLAAWPRLVGWRREDAEGARLRDQLRDAARQWHARGRPRGLLWRDDALAEYRIWRARYPGALTGLEDEFGRASTSAAARGLRVRRSLIALAFVVLAAGAAVLFTLRARAEDARQRAHVQLRDSYEEQGRRALLDGDPGVALGYLDQAFQMGADSPALRFMLARAIEPLTAERFTLAGHTAQVWVSSFSPDGTRVLTASSDGTARIWDAATGAELLRLEGHAEGMLFAAWSPDGALAATGDAAGVVRLWSAITGERRHELRGHTGGFVQLVFSRDGRRLATAANDASVRLWDVEHGSSVATFDEPGQYTVDLSPDGGRLVTAGQDGRAALWDVRGQRLASLQGHTGAIWFARFSPDGQQVLTGSLDRTGRLWDAMTGAPLVILRGHDERVTHVSFSPDGKRVATASADRTARLWDARTGELQSTLRGHTAQVNRLAFTNDGQSVMTAAGDGTARVWDVHDGIETAAFLHGGFVFDVAVSPDGRVATTASWSGSSKLWSMAEQRRIASWHDPETRPEAIYDPIVATNGKNVRVLHVTPHSAVLWDPDQGMARAFSSETTLISGDLSHDGALIALADADGTLKVIATATGATSARIVIDPGEVADAAFSPSGTAIATASADGEVVLWDIATADALARRSLAMVPEEVSFSGNGARVLAWSTRGPAPLLLDGTTLAVVAELRGHTAAIVDAAFSLDGRRLATASADATVRVWDADGTLITTLHHDAEVFAVAWSPSENRLLTGAGDGTATLWDLESGEPRAFKAHDNFVATVAFTLDGRLATTSGGDGFVRVWDPSVLSELFRIPAVSWAAVADLDVGLGVLSSQSLTSWRSSYFLGDKIETRRLATEVRGRSSP